MPRIPRQVVPGAPHHLVLRGNNRRVLFSYPRDYLRFLRLLRKQLTATAVLLHALCLMRNHVHLLATPPTHRAFADLVKGVAQPYAQVRNLRYKASGKLFEQRYFSKPVRSEPHLALVTAYVDLNPVRAGLVADAAAYPWSTFHVHAGLEAPMFWDLWTPSHWYESLGSSSAKRARAYVDWTQECVERDQWSDVHRDPAPSVGAPPIRPNRSRAAG